MTGFRKVDLPHISTLPTLTSHNFRLENSIDLQFDQFCAPASLIRWRKFQSDIQLEH